MRRSWIRVSATFLLALSAVLPMAARAADDELVDRVVRLLGDSDREFRAAGLDRVRTSARGEAHTKTFAAQLPKLDPSAQAALVIALADRGDSAARPAIVELLAASQDEQVRSAALAALGEIGSTDDLPTLVKALSASSSAERQSARTALVRMRGDSVVKALAADAQTAAPATKTTLIEVLATRRAADAMPLFLASSMDDDGQVRRAAMNALGQLAGADQIGAMIPAVLKAEKGFE
ncbi:MAG TPA: HEAT repeat domain-containing protein, partial [Pirellulales bacterium]|nr:HEAT repeat domain-containing protein [Pirellulales bacterium]